MAFISLKPALLATVVALLSYDAEAFTAPMQATAPRVKSVTSLNSFFMSEDDKKEEAANPAPAPESKEEKSLDKFQMTSARKEVVFDEKSGRFFETNRDAADCIPDEEYCQLDEDTGEMIRLTVAEKERIFLDALQSYYINGRQLLPDEEFDALKEDLSWSGSKLVVLNREETKYLSAMQAYMKGAPILSDTEFDALKTELKEAGSQIAVDSEPKCYIDTGVCKVTLQEDNFRSNLLYLPAGAILLVVWLGLGFEFIEPFIRINPVLLIALGSPFVYNGAKIITDNFIFTDNEILYGPCPSCETENRVYFGGILGVEGFTDTAEIKCTKCKEVITVQRNTKRASTLPKA
ncbi:unnamed protein product [Cylindrotheca closterium]|uniref:Uncharacterized protein n=1 Tax=Cylindrotheca closterium TaxID=2856 RepID=A0AAD2GA25_9STRA|nr:unnamed protein product [Cylindrotheca closterium]